MNFSHFLFSRPKSQLIHWPSSLCPTAPYPEAAGPYTESTKLSLSFQIPRTECCPGERNTDHYIIISLNTHTKVCAHTHTHWVVSRWNCFYHTRETGQVELIKAMNNFALSWRRWGLLLNQNIQHVCLCGPKPWFHSSRGQKRKSSNIKTKLDTW